MVAGAPVTVRERCISVRSAEIDCAVRTICRIASPMRARPVLADIASSLHNGNAQQTAEAVVTVVVSGGTTDRTSLEY